MYIEIVDSDGIHSYNEAQKALSYLSVHPANLRLDLHGVLDILSTDVHLGMPTQKVVCISYVGSVESPVYSTAVLDIQQRIRVGQIAYGVLVFTRGRGSGAARHAFVEEGSKAWVNHWIPRSPQHGPCVFIDDSTDHLRSTFELSPDIQCLHFNLKNPAQLCALLLEMRKACPM